MIQYIITAIIDVVVASIAVSKRRDGAAISLALLAISAGLWSLELYLLTIITNLDVLEKWYAVFRSGMFFIPSTMALFVWFLVGKRSKLFFRFVVLPGLVVSALLSILNNTIFPSELTPADNGFIVVIDNVYLGFVANFVYCVIGAILFCASQYKSAVIREKQRIKWLLITLAVAFLFGVSSLYLFSFSFYLAKLSGPLTNIVFLTSLLYATIRHDLMDLRLALSVGLARVILLAAFCWTFFSLDSAVAFTSDTVGGTITLLVFLVVVLETYPKMLQWLTPNTKRMFKATSYDFENAALETQINLDKCISFSNIKKVLDNLLLFKANLNSYSLVVRSRDNIEIDRPLFKSINDLNFSLRLEKNEKISLINNSGKLILLDEVDQQLREKIADIKISGVLALAFEGELLGIIAVSHSKNSNRFDYEDIRLLEWLAKELPQTLWRIQNLEIFEEELIEAKKKLSLINVMNHYHHDIKAPLSIIDGVVTHELYDKEKQRQIILEQVALGSKLITTMANLLKGKRRRDVGLVSINTIINDAILIFNHALANSEIEIGEDAVVMGDADDLKILFINLIKNASEAVRSHEKVSIKVKAWRENKVIKVSFSDNGTGMSQQQLHDIWNFGISTKVAGSGIGLQAIKRIAEEHHATINVASQLGKGTSIELAFPLSA